MPVALGSQQFENTCRGNQSTNVEIALEPAVREDWDRVHWNPLGKGNRMVYAAKSPHTYRAQQREKGRYLNGQMSARVGKGHIGIHSARVTEWYRFRCVCMPIEISREKKADTSAGRCLLGSGRILLEPSERGGLNSRGLQCLDKSCGNPHGKADLIGSR